MGFRRIELNFHDKKLLYFKTPLMIRALEVLLLAVPATESVLLHTSFKADVFSKCLTVKTTLWLQRRMAYETGVILWGYSQTDFNDVSRTFCRSLDGRHKVCEG
jgi:hypothetical protein